MTIFIPPSPTMRPPPTTEAVIMALVDLANCVCNELAESGAGETCWCGLYPGQTVSWEFCGECSGARCGMGYTRLVSVFPYSTFPLPEIDERCLLPLVWAVEVGALRCVPQPANGEITDTQTMSEVAISQVLDASALYRAVKCCDLDAAVQGYQPVGPAGGCVGGYWTAYLPVT